MFVSILSYHIASTTIYRPLGFSIWFKSSLCIRFNTCRYTRQYSSWRESPEYHESSWSLISKSKLHKNINTKRTFQIYELRRHNVQNYHMADNRMAFNTVLRRHRRDRRPKSKQVEIRSFLLTRIWVTCSSTTSVRIPFPISPILIHGL